MDINELNKIINESPSIRLFRKNNWEHILRFFVQAFPENDPIEDYSLQRKLEYFLDDNLPEEEDKETNDVKAKRWIREWTDSGLMTNYQNEEGDIMYELTYHSLNVLNWIETLKKKEYIGTESKFKNLLSQVQNLDEYSEQDRESRIEKLEKDKEEIEEKIKNLKEGGNLEFYEKEDIQESYLQIINSAKEILQDFSLVDENIKKIMKDIQIRNLSDSKTMILGKTFSAINELKDSPQGRNFYAFFTYIQSIELQNQWNEHLHNIEEKLKQFNINIGDNNIAFLDNLMFNTFKVCKKIADQNYKMADKICHVIQENKNGTAKREKELFNGIKNLITKIPDNSKLPDITLFSEEINTYFPFERPLQPVQLEKHDFQEIEDTPELTINDLKKISVLFNEYVIPSKVIRERIADILYLKGQTTIAQLVDKYKITKGLSEVFCYITILDEYDTSFVPDEYEEIAFSENKIIRIPTILIFKHK